MYDKQPYIAVSSSAKDCLVGWESIGKKLKDLSGKGRSAICVECYPGALVKDIEARLKSALEPVCVISTEDLLQSSAELNARLEPILTDDPVFGMMTGIEVEDYFDKAKLKAAQEQVAKISAGTVLIVGTGAVLVAAKHDVLVYADMARWEIQMRQRRNEVGNLGAENLKERPALKYKRAFFLDWRAADRLKQRLMAEIDFVLDTNDAATPKMIAGEAMREGLRMAAKRPFRVVPFFDPGPWGGHWMEKVCDLPTDVPNHAWCFDCVPEENSMLLGFGDARVEIPSINLVFAHPVELMGKHIYEALGAEFPIRFDFLDTMGGGNLSLQVHPLTSYIREKFGMTYTQDESYYMLDADAGACVYLGLKTGIYPTAMVDALQVAQDGGAEFDAERFVNKWPAKKHDHFLIPAGTVHCSGSESMVLEISATPYIFTFKLWDWGRLGLDGRPRPIHLKHGAENIQWDRTTEWVKKSLVNHIEPIATGDGWREERTGLHEYEFIETRRHWFTGTVAHDTNGTVHVLNLVEGAEAIVESPTGAFEPYVVHYAETFIVPAQVGAYTIRPYGAAAGKECGTLKAYVRKIKN